MRELNVNEVQEVNGGLVQFLVVAAVGLALSGCSDSPESSCKDKFNPAQEPDEYSDCVRESRKND